MSKNKFTLHAFVSRYKKLSFWNKIGFISGLIGIISLPIAVIMYFFPFPSSDKDNIEEVREQLIELNSKINVGILESNSIYEPAEEIIRNEFGFELMKINISTMEVQYQTSSCENEVDFEEALRSAMNGFIFNGDDVESPKALIMNDFYVNENEAEDMVVTFLNDTDSYIELVPFTDEYPAEHGELLQENWIFYLNIPDLSDHLYWAIVDRSGELPVYVYGFN